MSETESVPRSALINRINPNIKLNVAIWTNEYIFISLLQKSGSYNKGENLLIWQEGFKEGYLMLMEIMTQANITIQQVMDILVECYSERNPTAIEIKKYHPNP
jgi:hypothetical protein